MDLDSQFPDSQASYVLDEAELYRQVTMENMNRLEVVECRDNVLLGETPDFSLSLPMNESSESAEMDVEKLFNNDDLLNARRLIMSTPAAIGPTIGIAAVPGPSSEMRREQEMLFRDDEAILLTDWPGKLNFAVNTSAPSSSPERKKWVYCKELNKIYCKSKVNVPFVFEMDYSSIQDVSNLKILVSLMFEDHDMRNVAVSKCNQCQCVELRDNGNIQQPQVMHIVKPEQETPEIEYYSHPDAPNRCVLLIKAKLPGPGSNSVTQNLLFTCSNSHFKYLQQSQARAAGNGPASATRNVSIVFALLEGKNVIGRATKHIRICSAPLRDCNKDIDNMIDGKSKEKAERRRKCESAEGHGASSKKTKKVEIASKREEEKPTKVSSSSSQNPFPFDEDVASCSQESVYSCADNESKIMLKPLVRDIKWCLLQKKSEDPNLQAYSKHVFITMTMLQSLCKEAKKIEQTRKALVSIPEEDEKSPDGGFHEVAQD